MTTKKILVLFISLTLLLLGCDSNDDGQANIVQNLDSSVALVPGATPPPANGGTGGGSGVGSPASLTFIPPSPAQAGVGISDIAITAVGTPAGGFITLSNINADGTGGTFITGPGPTDFTFTSSTVTTLGVPTVDVTYTPLPPFQPITLTYTINLLAGSPSSLVFTPPPPLDVVPGSGDVVITATGTPAGGTIALSNIVGGGTGGTFVLGPGANEFTFTGSTATTDGTATVDVTYTPPFPDLPSTATYTVNVLGTVTLYVCAGATSSNSSTPFSLYTVDIDTAAETLIGPIGVTGAVSSMVRLPDNSLLGTARTAGTLPGSLIDIDPLTGAGTIVAAMSSCAGFTDMTYDPTSINPITGATGVVWAAQDPGCSDSFGAVDETTGTVITLGPTGFFCCGNGMALDPATGTIYYASSSAFLTISPTTGAGTTVGTGTYTKIRCMDFHPLTGVLYAINASGTDTLVTIDPSTGAIISTIGPVVSGADSMAFRFD